MYATPAKTGAHNLTRTDDLPLTRRLLYQLSYAGTAAYFTAWPSRPAPFYNAPYLPLTGLAGDLEPGWDAGAENGSS